MTAFLTFIFICKNHLKGVQTSPSVESQTLISVQKENTSPTSFV